MGTVYVSVFSGIGGWDLGAYWAGWKFSEHYYSEIELYPIEVFKLRFPDAIGLGDIRNIKGEELRNRHPGEDFVMSGSSPCFPAGALVLTDKGLIPIEKVSVGDKVLTHRGRFRRVLAVGGRKSATVILKGTGHCGLEVTPNHPIYCREKISIFIDKSMGQRRYFMSPQWVQAADSLGYLWGNVSYVPKQEIPKFVYSLSKYSHVRNVPNIDEDFFYFIGRYLGDGWVVEGREGRNGVDRIYICCSKQEVSFLFERLNKLGFILTRSDERTVVKLSFTSSFIGRWLLDNFGKYCHGKKLPSWVFGMKREFQSALLRGYVDSDGHKIKDGGFSFITVSRELAFGVKILASKLGYTVCINYYKSKPWHIEGRSGESRGQYTVRLYNIGGQNRSSCVKSELHWFGLIKKILKGRESVPVYNLEVEEDNSYTIDGIVVHNCQDISVAGKRHGIMGKESSLWFEYARLIAEIRPKFAFLENVGAITSSGLHLVLSGLFENGYDAEWVVLHASDVGAPHKRERLWLLAYPIGSGWERGSYGGRASGEVSGGKQKAGILWGADSTFLAGSSYGQEVVAYPNLSRCEGVQDGSTWDPFEGSLGKSGFGGAWSPESQPEPLVNGVPVGVGRYSGEGHGDKPERVRYKYPANRTGQLKGYGNAIVPQIAELLWARVKWAMENGWVFKG